MRKDMDLSELQHVNAWLSDVIDHGLHLKYTCL